MRNLIALTTLLATASVAHAQGVPYSQTLDSQMQRMEAGQPAVPPAQYQHQTMPQTAVPIAQPAYRDWPQQGMAPAAGPSQTVSVAPSGEVIHSLGGNAIPALPLEIRTVGDVRYITGGVGDEEKAQLAMVENDYNVRMLIAATGGAYISGAMVRIVDAQGRLLLSTDGAGPYLYATLPAGKYSVEVTAPEGGIKRAEVTVPAKGVVKPVVRFAL